MRFKPSVLVLPVLLLLTSTGPAQVVRLLDLNVVNGSDQARVNEPVSFGIPVPKQSYLYSLSWLQVVDQNNQAVPHQFKVLTRWGGDRNDVTKPIRWALVTLNANAPANSTATYGIAIGAPPAHGDLFASDQMNYIEVHTSANTYFRVSKWQFHLFDAAVVNGTSLVTPGRLDMVMPNGTLVTPTITETVLEEYAGWQSLRCVVRQRGQLGQLRFTARWFFHSGRSDVTFDFRLENPQAYGLFSTVIPDGQIYFDSLHLVQPVLGGSSYTVTTDAATRTVTSSQDYQLKQDFDMAALTNPMDLWTGFSFTETQGGTQVGSGNRFNGSIDLRGSAGGVTVTLDRFWQNFPKSFRAQSNEIQVGLFPEWGNGPEYKGQYEGPASTAPTDPMALTNYRFEGGRWKTHRMVFNFHLGTTTTAAVLGEAVRVNAPLIGTAPPAWIRLTGATGVLWMERQPTTDPAVQRWERFTDMLASDSYADVTMNGQIGFAAFTRRGGTYGGFQSYGWENFGDLVWGDGYASQHYDWTASFLDGFWRTGDYRCFNSGRDVAVSRRDYNQNHSTNTAEIWRGSQYYEKGWWHGNFVSGDDAHNWLEGLLIYYVMTGDEAAREAALENTGYLFRKSPKNWDGYWGSRIAGWSIDNLMAAYAYLGDPAYLNEAGLGVYRYEQLEQAGGGLGCVINPGNGLTAGWMENIVQIAAAKYYLASGDAGVLPLLNRMRNFFKNEICVLPTGTYPNVTIPMVHETWSPTASGILSVHLGWAMSQSFAYSAVVFNDQNDLAWSKCYFDGAARYWQAGGGMGVVNGLNSSTWSPITFRPTQYPNSESKVIGNVLRWGTAQGAARHLLGG